ncbi:E7 [Gammapapillomavirus 25]|uniref:Protein E7 n=2 Tax=Papillomaviridae TaxID=151340 RepID=A0A0K1YX29_9PAPI|nr:E7 [Human papillomavirus]AKZ17779.1 E7 [Human papillomavirus]ATQ38603.1 E7 [Gammapapillomavirus 25]AYA93545.1 MAG: E7 protein [Human papillomavirus]
MIGPSPNNDDIELDLHDLVLPSNLISEESLSPDVDPEEEEQLPFAVETSCKSCGAGVRFTVCATHAAIRTLQILLLQELSLICLRCSRSLIQHGRPH